MVMVTLDFFLPCVSAVTWSPSIPQGPQDLSPSPKSLVQWVRPSHLVNRNCPTPAAGAALEETESHHGRERTSDLGVGDLKRERCPVRVAPKTRDNLPLTARLP
ncbi:hypothetical protein QBC45DRAFT_407257 [Copromyces sp. CBS 386.78]|nr:hypothetical protein QBC45DRAFT_407257 [Copromyces sp. CBS 386.78]